MCLLLLFFFLLRLSPRGVSLVGEHQSNKRGQDVFPDEAWKKITIGVLLSAHLSEKDRERDNASITSTPSCLSMRGERQKVQRLREDGR